MPLELKAVERRRRACTNPVPPPTPLGTDTVLGQWHRAAIAMYDIRRHLEPRPEAQDGSPTHSLGLLEMPLEADESIIAMNKRLIQEVKQSGSLQRNALMQQKELWQAELQGQHDSLQEVVL
ncbi:hypothetical protein ACHHYP_20238 [Achlya hypogyna]|uniref:Uncharacterized protein n=1 Tax=Achlya hypogyna TaxID=1202772 RepID=A0A1V9ZNF7_ACHHY|nr:hypothetical protein ACHHYP_20238 [Achlya hypogyna]